MIGEALLGRLLPPVAALLDDLGAAAGRAGARLWLVGGAVRDLWLGEPSADVDLVVEGDFEAAAAAITAAGHGVDAKAASFLTYRVAPRADVRVEGLTIDLGATRRERYPRAAALPVVEAGTLDEDLRRRDVTLNAVAVRLDPAGRGAVADPTGGLADLAAGRLRVLHERSFEDDPTRAFRVARFAGRYGFAVEEATAASLAAAVRGGLVDRLSAARVRAQLALLAAETPLEGPTARHEALGVLAAVHPAIAPAAGVAAALDAAAAGLRALGVPTGDPLARFLLAALAGRADADIDAVLARLGMGGAPGRRLAGEARRLPALAASLAREPAAPRALHDALAGADPAAVAAAVALGGPAAAREASRFALDLAPRRPRLDGRALAALGVAPGPAVGRVLDRLLTERLEGRLPSRDDEVAFVRRLLAGGSVH